MASQADDHGHLDATAGREVIYCHACSHEWYRDEHGLECPECHSDITEVIEPENDPRDLDHPSSTSTSPEPGRRRTPEDDSEDEQYFAGPHGFHFQRTVRDGPNQNHLNTSVDPVLERFMDMFQGFRPPGPMNRPMPFTHEYTQGRIQRTTFTSGPFGGTTSITIMSRPLINSRAGDEHGGLAFDRGQEPGDPFQALFSNIMRDVGPPEDDTRGGAEGTGERPPPPGFARSLQELLSLISPGGGTVGDAVYSQEALDRIITSLMEANPQSNAAPPATEEALKNLSRKEVDKEMLEADEKTECTICIDEMKVGETAIYLPCNHWFHEDCVVLWLKEHNTCPICRTPIEKSDGSSTNNRSRNGSSADNTTEYPGGSSARLSRFSSRFHASPGSESTGISPRPLNTNLRRTPSGPDSSQGRPAWDEPVSSRSDLNPFANAFRSFPDDRDQNRDQNRDRETRGFSTGFRYDPSRAQRRNSHSPTSPRMTGPEEHGARMRQRSPSQSRWPTNREREQRRPSGHGGALGWLRDRFGSGGPGSGSSRDERRQ